MSTDSNPTVTSLQELFHHRWTVPVIATLYSQGGGAKFATLQHTLGVSRDSLTRALRALLASEAVMRNPGYGHPMRPEYLLGERGRRLGPGCRRLQDQLTRWDIADVALRKWSLPVTYAVATAGGRFNRIREALSGATPRAVSAALRDLQEANLLERFLVDDDPPRTEYGLTARARRLLPVLTELARVA